MFETEPFAVTGFILGFYRVINILQKHKIKTLILSIIIYNVIADYKIFRDIRGVIYFGIELNVKSLCIVCIFSLFPSEKINNKYISKFLIFITNYTAGVYYLHMTIPKYFFVYSNEIKKGTFLGVIYCYLICYFICFFGMVIFGKTPFRYLFC